MSRIVTGDGEIMVMRARARIVPIASTIAGSAVTLLPVVATSTLLPPCGLLMLLGWRLLRPQLWPVWMALPLGLVDDLLSGQPLGSAMTLWAVCLLVLDTIDQRLIWRDYWQEWALAAVLIAFCLFGGMFVLGAAPSDPGYALVVPQILVSVLAFPFFLRLCAGLDRWRLA